MNRIVVLTCTTMLAVLTVAIEPAVAQGVWSYQDDFETDKATSESWQCSPFVEEVPYVSICGFLHYEPGVTGRGLGFYEGFEVDCPPFLSYATIPAGTACTGGLVELDLVGWGTMIVLGSSDGTGWTTLGSVTVAGKVQPVSLSIPPDAPAQFLKFVGYEGGASLEHHPIMDNFQMTLGYVLLGDVDGDGDVDLTDFATFIPCYSGAAVTTSPPGCSADDFAAADLDGDEDVDLGDFATFAVNYTGAQ
jgi:hypothetical protein